MQHFEVVPQRDRRATARSTSTTRPVAWPGAPAAPTGTPPRRRYPAGSPARSMGRPRSRRSPPASPDRARAGAGRTRSRPKCRPGSLRLPPRRRGCITAQSRPDRRARRHCHAGRGAGARWRGGRSPSSPQSRQQTRSWHRTPADRRRAGPLRKHKTCAFHAFMRTGYTSRPQPRTVSGRD